MKHSEELLSHKDFKKDKMTVFYIHGYKETAEKESIHTVISAYLESKPEDNIVLLDWSNMAMGSYYVNAAPNTRKVMALIHMCSV